MPAPLVVSTDPTPDAVDASINGPIRFTFSTDINPESANASTFQVIQDDTLDPAPGSVYVSGAVIVFLPSRALTEGYLYKAVAVGQDIGGDTSIESTTGDSLVETYEVRFRTKSTGFVPLSEVTDLHSLDGVGPVREVDPVTPEAIPEAAVGLGPLEITKAVPPGFTSQVDPCIDQLHFRFNQTLNPTGATDLMTIEAYPIIDEPYEAAVDGTGQIWWRAHAPTGVVNGVTPPDFMNPTGTWLVTGQDVYWTRGTGEPCFNYNSEILVRFEAELEASAGGELGVDVELIYSTTMWPMYVGIRQMRLELGPIGRDLYDDTIARVIHMNSIDAWEQAAGAFDIDDPYPSVKRYVKCKSFLDLTDYIADLEVSHKDHSKALGDLEIRFGPKASRMSSKRDRMEACYKKSLRELRQLRHQSDPTVAIKGINSPTDRKDFRRRTWDQASLGLEGRIAPIANTELARMRKLLDSHDHHDHRMAVYYGRTNKGGRGFFRPQSGDQP